MKIKIYRPKQFIDMARVYKLYADDQEVAIIKRGIEKTITIPDSTRNLVAKIDWCSSPAFSVQGMKENRITIKNSFGDNLFKVLLLTLYYITLGKNEYLVIENEAKNY